MAVVLGRKPGGGGSSAPSGPAGGDLAGTYPNPTLAANSVDSAAIDAADAGNILTDLGVSAFVQTILNDANGLAVAATLGIGQFASYTPALTASTSDPTLGTGSSVAGRWCRIGQLGIVFARINWGTSGTNAGSGTYRISLPFTVGASQITIQGGLTLLEDNSGGDEYAAAGYGVAGQAYAQMYLAQTLTNGLVTNAVPFAWAANDIIAATIICEIA